MLRAFSRPVRSVLEPGPSPGRVAGDVAYRRGMTEPPYLAAVRQSYDTVATAYAERVPEPAELDAVSRAMLAAFAEMVRAGGPVADLGCGPGKVTAVRQDAAEFAVADVQSRHRADVETEARMGRPRQVDHPRRHVHAEHRHTEGGQMRSGLDHVAEQIQREPSQALGTDRRGAGLSRLAEGEAGQRSDLGCFRQSETFDVRRSRST